MDMLMRPINIATSKPARQTYLNTALLLLTSSILLGVAVFAYVLFYVNFIPQIGIERDVHLQFLPTEFAQKPYAFVPLQSSVVTQQTYDIKIELNLPRSPSNLETGNFMISMTLLSNAFSQSASIPDLTLSAKVTDYIPESTILHTSSRHAILTYHSPIIRLSKTLAGLPWYLLNIRREDETLSVMMAEGLYFPRGRSNVPETIFLELQTFGRSGSEIEVYDAKLKLRARFGGLRWVMYNHRLISLVVFTSAFWFAEVVFTVLAWFMLSSLGSGKSGQNKNQVKGEFKGEETDGSTAAAIKAEKEEGDMLETDDADLSDTPRNFPTYGRQPPLYYSGASRVKQEEDGEEDMLEDLAIQPLEADDESEEVGGRSRYDSGIGTSFSEGPRSGGTGTGVQRRRSRGGS